MSRLVALLDGGNALDVHAYNDAGQRIEIQDAAAHVRVFVYDDRSLLEEYDTGSLRRHGRADRLIGLGTAAGTYALHLGRRGRSSNSWPRPTATAPPPRPASPAASSETTPPAPSA